jgi:hypothetical protein
MEEENGEDGCGCGRLHFVAVGRVMMMDDAMDALA